MMITYADGENLKKYLMDNEIINIDVVAKNSPQTKNSVQLTVITHKKVEKPAILKRNNPSRNSDVFPNDNSVIFSLEDDEMVHWSIGNHFFVMDESGELDFKRSTNYNAINKK